MQKGCFTNCIALCNLLEILWFWSFEGFDVKWSKSKFERWERGIYNRKIPEAQIYQVLQGNPLQSMPSLNIFWTRLQFPHTNFWYQKRVHVFANCNIPGNKWGKNFITYSLNIRRKIFFSVLFLHRHHEGNVVIRDLRKTQAKIQMYNLPKTIELNIQQNP